MLLRKKLIACLQKSICGWLIFCVGGAGSLTYYDGFLPGHEHGGHLYHLSILEEIHLHQPPSWSEVMAEQRSLWPASRLKSQAASILTTHPLALGFSRFFSSDLSDGYLVTAANLNILDLPLLFGSIPSAVFLGQSAWLGPPDKPPIHIPGEIHHPRCAQLKTAKF